MKKSILTCIVVGFLSLSSVVHAQAPIPNGDFELWSEGTPDGWVVDNSGLTTPVTDTSDAHSGSHAAMGTVISLQGFGQLAPTLISGTKSAAGFLYSDHPNSFTGFYKFNPVGSDSISITCAFEKNGTGIGAGHFFTHTSASGYTSFAVPIYWSSSDAPDTAIVSVSIVASFTGTSNVGSTMQVDDLAFSNQSVSAVGESAASPSFDLEQNYPNPLTSDITTTIAYSLEEPGFASLVVYDINGRVVATPVHEMLSNGNHIAQIDCSRLPAGVYSYRLTCGAHSATRTMQILH